jgi:hypothetical protein
MRNILYSLLLCLSFACSEVKSENDKKTLDFGLFTIETPKSWSQVKAQGIDSYVGRIAIDKTDTLEFDLGWYSNTLTETEPQIIERQDLKNMQIAYTSEYIIVDSRRGIDIDVYRKCNISWDTINGRKAKIIFPRTSGMGITGVYIDSLWSNRGSVDRFNLYGEGLKPENQKRFLDAIKTLRFVRS